MACLQLHSHSPPIRKWRKTQRVPFKGARLHAKAWRAGRAVSFSRLLRDGPRGARYSLYNWTEFRKFCSANPKYVLFFISPAVQHTLPRFSHSRNKSCRTVVPSAFPVSPGSLAAALQDRLQSAGGFRAAAVSGHVPAQPHNQEAWPRRT